MVSKPFEKREAVTLPLFFFIFFAFLFFGQFTAKAQNISKSYVASSQPDGILYFIVAQKGFKNADARIEYDITYKTSQDSALFNFSYFDKAERGIDSIALHTQDKSILLYPNRIFVEPKKDLWHYRYTSAVLLKDLEKFYTQTSETARIFIYSSGNQSVASIKKSAWENQASKLNKIFTMINLNSRNKKP